MPGTTPRGYPYPLYSEANDFPTQLGDLATAIDTDVQTNLVTAVNAGLNQPCVRAADSGGAPQSIPTGVLTAVNFPFEVFDNAGMFNPGVSQTDFTIQVSGVYLVMAYITFPAAAGSATDACIVGTYRNGIRIAERGQDSPNTDDVQVAFTILSEYTAGQVVTFGVLHNATAARNITSRAASLARISG